MVSPLPLAASTNTKNSLKATFRPGRFRDAANNQQIASAFPCLDPKDKNSNGFSYHNLPDRNFLGISMQNKKFYYVKCVKG